MNQGFTDSPSSNLTASARHEKTRLRARFFMGVAKACPAHFKDMIPGSGEAYDKVLLHSRQPKGYRLQGECGCLNQQGSSYPLPGSIEVALHVLTTEPCRRDRTPCPAVALHPAYVHCFRFRKGDSGVPAPDLPTAGRHSSASAASAELLVLTCEILPLVPAWPLGTQMPG